MCFAFAQPPGCTNGRCGLDCVWENAEARICSERAWDIGREIGDRRSQGYALTGLGHALVGQGHLQGAVRAYQDALNIRRELGDYNLAIVALWQAMNEVEW